MSVHVIVGGQFGSEAKGHVAAQVVQRVESERIKPNDNICVRVGGPNAGHSVQDAFGRVWAFRTVPVAAPISGMDLCIAAGSEIDLAVLRDEVEMLHQVGIDVRDRLFIDSQATIITDAHKDAEHTLDMRGRIGSTAKGIGAARSSRIMRRAPIAAHYLVTLADFGTVCDTSEMLNRRSRNPQTSVVIEGTQGYGLGLHAGYYPFCTSGDCRSVDFLSQAGIHPVRNMDAFVVFRTFPIRVAGNSGPMFEEVSWEQLGEESGGYIQPERTTVTKLVRRVGRWDEALARRAIDANGGAANPTLRPVLTFVDYLDPKLAGSTSFAALLESPAWSTISKMEMSLGVGFSGFTTGPGSIIWRTH